MAAFFCPPSKELSTTKGTKYHEGNPEKAFLDVTSCPWWLVNLEQAEQRRLLRSRLELLADPFLKGVHVLGTSEKILDQIICGHGPSRL
jgi:hypothetical protein